MFSALPQAPAAQNTAPLQQMKSIPRPPQSSNTGFASKPQTNDFDIFGMQSSTPQPQSFPSSGQSFGAPPSSGFPFQQFGAPTSGGFPSQSQPFGAPTSSGFPSQSQSFGSSDFFGGQPQYSSASSSFQPQQPSSSGMFVSPPSADIFGSQPVPQYTAQTSFTSQAARVQKPAQAFTAAPKKADEGFTAFQSSQPETFSGIGGLVNLGSLKKKEEPPKTDKKVNLFSGQAAPAPSYSASWGAPAPSAGYGYGGMGSASNMYAPQSDMFSSGGMYSAPQPTFGFTQASQPASQPPMGGFTGFAPPSQNKSSSSGFGANSKGGNSLFD